MQLPDKLQVPSGAVFLKEKLQCLIRAGEAGSIKYLGKPVTMKNKVLTYVYVFLRGDLTDDAVLNYLVGRCAARSCVSYMQSIGEQRQLNLIGLPTAGTAIAIATSVASVSLRAEDENFPLISSRIMREVKKTDHGTHGNWVNGETSGLPNLQQFFFGAADNVVTDAGTKVESATRFLEDGYPAYDMLQYIFVDRQQGGVPRMVKAGFKHVAVEFLLLDMAYAYGEIGMWPKQAVKQVEEEIKAF